METDIRQAIDDLLEAIEFIEQFVDGKDAEAYHADPLLRHAIDWNLLRASGAIRRILRSRPTFSESIQQAALPLLQWRDRLGQTGGEDRTDTWDLIARAIPATRDLMMEAGDDIAEARPPSPVEALPSVSSLAATPRESEPPTPPTDSLTLRRVLDRTTDFLTRKRIDSPRLCAEMILAHVLCVRRIGLYTGMNQVLSQQQVDTARDLVRRVGEHEPIQHVVGVAHFYNLDFEVNRDVLIPRPDTETLVERALSHLKAIAVPQPRVLDLCTGSGCIAIAIARQHAAAEVFASDISLPAIDVARRNLQRHQLADRVTLQRGDLFEPLASLSDARPFDLITANPPYIPTDKLATLDRNVRDYEPRAALDGGSDGLDVHRRIIATAARHLTAVGALLLEIACDQEEAILWALRNETSLNQATVFRDYGGRPRVAMAGRA